MPAGEIAETFAVELSNIKESFSLDMSYNLWQFSG